MPKPVQSSPLANKYFLIVDDFQGVRNILTNILRTCGADGTKIETAANGSEALAWLKRQAFDVVLCDFNLGPGKNGQNVLEEAKEQKLIGPACTWIIVTADKTSHTVAGHAEHRPDAYMLKPITEAMVRQRLDRVWAKKEAFGVIELAARENNFDKAMALCDEAMTTHRANIADLMRAKAEYAMTSGQPDVALQVYDRMLILRDVPWAKTGIARIHIQQGRLDDARRILEQTIQDWPAFMEAHDLLAQFQINAADLDAALISLERAARISPNSVFRQSKLGDVALKLGKPDRAEKAFRKCIDLGENSIFQSPQPYLGLARACSANTNAGEALKALAQALKVFDDEDIRVKARAIEGIVHHAGGNMEMSKTIAGEFVQRLDSGPIAALLDGQASLDLARLLFHTDHADIAIQLLKSQVSQRPEDLAMQEEVKKIFEQQNMADEGKQLVEESRKEGNERMNRGVLLARDGKYEEAIEAMREAKQTMAHNGRVLFNLAHVIITRLQQVGNDTALANEAHATLLMANKLTPGLPRYAQLMASLQPFL